MLGCDVLVFRRGKSGEEGKIASWQTSTFGLNWLDELVKEKLAAHLSGGGYPDRYFVTAGVLLPIITAGLPENNNPLVISDDYVLPKNWSSDIVWNREAASACSKDDLLIIEAWDQS